MVRLLSGAAFALTITLWPRAGAADSARALTLERALARARERAPAVLAARLRVDEARGKLEGASALLPDNPVVSVAAGPHDGFENAVDIQLGLSQPFELGGRRGARQEAARAEIDHAVADSDAARADLLRAVATSFVLGLHARERVAAATGAEQVAAEIARAAEKRHRAGEIARLDVNVARAARARAAAELRAARGVEQAKLAELRMLLDLPPGAAIELAGDLRDRRRYAMDELLARAPESPELRALASEVKQAQADFALGRAMRWPDLTLGVQYQRDENENIFFGALSFSLPLFATGQELRATAPARQRRARYELDARRRALAAHIRAAHQSYVAAVEAVELLEAEALPVIDENEKLARKGYEAGQLSISEWLLIRRESLDTRADHLQRLLDAALAGVELEWRAGVLQ